MPNWIDDSADDRGENLHHANITADLEDCIIELDGLLQELYGRDYTFKIKGSGKVVGASHKGLRSRFLGGQLK